MTSSMNVSVAIKIASKDFNN